MEQGSLINSLTSKRSPLYLNPSKNSTLKPLVLTPLRKECCGSSLIVRNWPCFPVVYTTNGTFLAANFHGKCKQCLMTHYCNRYESTTEQLEYFEPIESVTYFQTSTQTTFEVKYLEHVTNMLAICNATLSIARLYNTNNATSDNDNIRVFIDYARTPDAEDQWKQNPQRLEEAWFLFSLVKFFSSRSEKNFYTEISAVARTSNNYVKLHANSYSLSNQSGLIMSAIPKGAKRVTYSWWQWESTSHYVCSTKTIRVHWRGEIQFDELLSQHTSPRR